MNKNINMYMDKSLIPNSCIFHVRHGTNLNGEKWKQIEICFNDTENIHLNDIHNHDQELVREVCGKIKELGLKHNIEDLSGVFISYKALQEIEREYQK